MQIEKISCVAYIFVSEQGDKEHGSQINKKVKAYNVLFRINSFYFQSVFFLNHLVYVW